MNVLLLLAALGWPELEAYTQRRWHQDAKLDAICEEALQRKNEAAAALSAAMRGTGLWTDFTRDQIVRLAHEAIDEGGFQILGVCFVPAKEPWTPKWPKP